MILFITHYTSFTLSYNTNTQVKLTAPSTTGTSVFSSWTGCDQAVGATCTVKMTSAKAVTANYTTSTNDYVLVVDSSNPSSGVAITVSPTDINSTSNGTTSFSLFYSQGAQVTLTAPTAVGENSFTTWTGCDLVVNSNCVVTMSSDREVIVSYKPLAQDFGTVLIGQASAVVPVAVTFQTSGTIGSMAALTQGSAGLDFAISSVGTCQVGTYIGAGNSCTVNLTFTPKFAGLRNGAVTIEDSGGNAIATGYVHGMGSGPQVSFLPGSQSTLHGGFALPQGVAVDGSGNLYVADSTNNAVYEVPAAGGYTSVKSLGGDFSYPTGVAMDGSGNVFVADAGNSTVKEIPPGCISYSCVKTLGGGTTFSGLLVGIAVDRSSNVFVATSGWNGNIGNFGGVYEIPMAGGYTTVNQLV